MIEISIGHPKTITRHALNSAHEAKEAGRTLKGGFHGEPSAEYAVRHHPSVESSPYGAPLEMRIG